MTRIKFEEHVLLYGADMSQWPDVLKAEGAACIAAQPQLQDVLNDAAEFERLATMRPQLAADDSFAERIIVMAGARLPASPWYRQLANVLYEALGAMPFPKPAYALAMLGIFAFSAGLMSQPESLTTSDAASVLYDARGIL